MSKRTFTDEQIVKILEESERTEESKAEFCRRHNISESGYYYWKKQFQGMQVKEVKRLKELEKENTRLKKLLADSLLAQEVLQEVVKKR
jgi:putative transposase